MTLCLERCEGLLSMRFTIDAFPGLEQCVDFSPIPEAAGPDFCPTIMAEV